ncbi:hypothetical protein [Lignipirellula cremea]|uniref:Uncharacterized protein n=1 Tax=Lignipirellula cremea TaxID=2528010 RepID=A0A518DMP8_9BACT|nr:hypothetical protein [Lignipirellula cremea]QDU93102.1 hypothetical protein Pla8534_08810 [Lignipirellula cremea]
MNRALRMAIASGVLPLLTGVAIFLLWLAWPLKELALAGIFVLLGGIVCFLNGGVALGLYWVRSGRDPAVTPRRRWLATLGAGALLLVNFPVAAGVIAAVVRQETRLTVQVDNACSQTLSNVRVGGGGCEAALGQIPPGESAKCYFWIEQDGSLSLQADREGASPVNGQGGYVTHAMGGHSIFTVQEDGTVQLEERRTRLDRGHAFDATVSRD